MGPNWTQAEGFILGVGAKMFAMLRCTYNERLDQSVKPFY